MHELRRRLQRGAGQPGFQVVLDGFHVVPGLRLDSGQLSGLRLAELAGQGAEEFCFLPGQRRQLGDGSAAGQEDQPFGFHLQAGAIEREFRKVFHQRLGHRAVAAVQRAQQLHTGHGASSFIQLIVGRAQVIGALTMMPQPAGCQAPGGGRPAGPGR